MGQNVSVMMGHRPSQPDLQNIDKEGILLCKVMQSPAELLVSTMVDSACLAK